MKGCDSVQTFYRATSDGSVNQRFDSLVPEADFLPLTSGIDGPNTGISSAEQDLIRLALLFDLSIRDLLDHRHNSLDLAFDSYAIRRGKGREESRR